MIEYKIFEGILNNFVVDESEVYYKTQGNGVIISDKSFLIKEKTHVSFSTFYNALDVIKIRDITDFNGLSIRIKGQGKAKIHIIYEYAIKGNYKKIRKSAYNYEIQEKEKKEILALEINGECDIDIPYFDWKDNGIVYLEIETSDNKFKLNSFEYFIQIEEINEVNLGIGICTFRREEYIRRNVSAINNFLKKYNLNYNIKIYISDNANTIKNIDNAYVYANPNTGGSGGFTRVIKEIKKDAWANYILLMDDDVLIEPMVIIRLYQLLKAAKVDISITGTMLQLSDPSVQQVCNEYIYTGSLFKSVNVLLDVRDNNSLISNSCIKKSTHGAWWFCCFSMDSIKHIGLPIQFFIKFDDIEFSYRRNKKFIQINGIGLWHEKFEGKFNEINEYFNSRNGLIFSVINNSYGKYMQKILQLILVMVAVKNYDCADIYLEAIKDFIKGPKYFFTTSQDIEFNRIKNIQSNIFYSIEELEKKLNIRIKVDDDPKLNFVKLFHLLFLNTFTLFSKKREYVCYNPGYKKKAFMSSLSYKNAIAIYDNDKVKVNILDRKRALIILWRCFKLYLIPKKYKWIKLHQYRKKYGEQYIVKYFEDNGFNV